MSNDSWGNAKELAKEIGFVPSSFQTAIRLLVKDQFQNDASMRPSTKYQVARIFKTPSFETMLYHASKEMRGELLAGHKHISVGMMMGLYDPFDLALMIGSYLLFRKNKKNLDPYAWEVIEHWMSKESQIGAQVGISIPTIGMGSTMLISTFRYFAYCIFAIKDMDKVEKHVVKHKDITGRWDYKAERDTWGCSSLELSVMMLSMLGYGVDVGEAYSAGADPDRKLPHLEADSYPYVMKLASIWLESFLMGKDQPRQQLPAKYFPKVSEKQRLIGKIAEIQEGKEHWLSKGKKDRSPEATPELFQETEVDDNAEFEVPDELKDVFSLEDICNMEEDEFDGLIDQIDDEQAGKVAASADVLSSEHLSQLEGIVD